MEDKWSRYTASGRKSGSPRGIKAIKHVLSDPDHGVKFEVFAYRDLTPKEVSAVVRDWMGARKMKDLTPWRTYRIQTDIGRPDAV